MVREKTWQVPYLAPAAGWLTWSRSPGVNMVTHTEIPAHGMTYMTYMAVPYRILPWQQLTIHTWEKPHGFLRNQGTKKPKNIRMRSVQCCCLCTSRSLSEAVKAGRLSRILVPRSGKKCELINDSAFKTWIDSHTPDTLFHCHFAPPQPSSTLGVSKRNGRSRCFSHFSAWIKKCLPWNDRWNTPV